ncbi:MAG: hypothetical protein GYA59_04585 [Chloroflexi bacterium]|nr:hypothetical protein [Chloroflexota bacterium]
MDNYSSPISPRPSRIGFHYYPDALHYRASDLQTWTPELKNMGVSWLVLQSPLDRAIPEAFITGLLDEQIEPIIQFNFSLASPPDPDDLRPLFTSYQRWGVRSVLLFDRPNARSSWPASGWTQKDLVNRFLDVYLPLANLALYAGLVPVLPPLEPGGSYWDTAFLRSTLELLAKRKEMQLLENLVISAYAWSGGHSLNWGAGGPERWPNSRPYFTSPDEEDQRGFRIFDWYKAIAQVTLGRTPPIMLLGAGIPTDPLQIQAETAEEEKHAATNLAVAKLLAGETVADPDDPNEMLEAIPEEVIACNFWLLATGANSPYQSQAWFHEDGRRLSAALQLRQWWSQPKGKQPTTFKNRKTGMKEEILTAKNYWPSSFRPIRHYLLLPIYENGSELEAIQPFVRKYNPTVGFSLAEAALASRVTVIGDAGRFPEETLERLRNAGCIVERVSGDGTSVATKLAER